MIGIESSTIGVEARYGFRFNWNTNRKIDLLEKEE